MKEGGKRGNEGGRVDVRLHGARLGVDAEHEPACVKGRIERWMREEKHGLWGERRPGSEDEEGETRTRNNMEGSC